MKFGLSDQQVDSYIATLREYGVSRAVIFGSRAMGNFRQNSDVDIAVFDDCAELIPAMRDALDELPYPHKIDVLAYNGIENSALRDHINRVGLDILPS